MQMRSERATSIDNLPGDTSTGGQTSAVNEILNDIHSNDAGGSTQIFERQTDGLVASPTENFVPQTDQEMQQLQEQQETIEGMNDVQPQQAPPLAVEEEVAPTVAPSIMTSPVAEKRFDFMTFAKTTLLFALIYMLFSFRQVKALIAKIPSFSFEGQPTVIGTTVCALVGGVIMAGVQTVV